MKIYGLWDGGVNYSTSTMLDVEVFASIRHARKSLLDRAHLGARYEVEFFYTHWVDRDYNQQWSYTPNADDGARMSLYRTDPSVEHDPMPFRILELTKRGVRVVTP